MVNYLQSGVQRDFVLKIDCIEFPADDFDAIQAFYENVFGWHFTDQGPEYRAFSDDTIKGGFYKSSQYSSTENGAALVILYSKNLEATLKRVVNAGGKIVVDIVNIPMGKRFQFADPHGNQLAVWSDQ